MSEGVEYLVHGRPGATPDDVPGDGGGGAGDDNPLTGAGDGVARNGSRILPEVPCSLRSMAEADILRKRSFVIFADPMPETPVAPSANVMSEMVGSLATPEVKPARRLKVTPVPKPLRVPCSIVTSSRSTSMPVLELSPMIVCPSRLKVTGASGASTPGLEAADGDPGLAPAVEVMVKGGVGIDDRPAEDRRGVVDDHDLAVTVVHAISVPDGDARAEELRVDEV